MAVVFGMFMLKERLFLERATCLASLPSKDSLEALIKSVDSAYVCPGNGDEKFVSVCLFQGFKGRGCGVYQLP